jgi:hypothetical protein
MVALAGFLALIGCGSEKEEEYRSEANAICAAEAKRFDRLPKASSLARVAKLAEKEIAIREDILTRLGELVAPKDIKGGAAELYADQEARLERAEAVKAAAEHKDRKKLRKVRHEGKTEFELEAGRAKAFGVPACAEL